MPIDPKEAPGAEIPLRKGGWTKDDVILHHLGIGAGIWTSLPI